MLRQIHALVEDLTPQLLDIRRHLHSHPELSGQEYKTAAYVSGVLSSCGLEVQELVGKTGVIGELRGSHDTRILGIRADMDGLPLTERVNLAFASTQPGLMHACGHDVHTTVAMGTAMVLAQLASPLPGTTRFLFQPAEETAQGARWMIEAGAMAGVSAMLGLHVYPNLAAGAIGIRYGVLTAAADDLDITIIGEAGHGARPHEAIDAIWIAAQVVTTLQQAISRTQNPLHPVVLTIGQIGGGRAANVIAERVTLSGTVRSLHPDSRKHLPEWIEKIVAAVCQPYGARCEIRYRRGVPSVVNDLALTELTSRCAREALGETHLQLIDEPSLGSEDFSLYLEHAPGTMFRLGVGFTDRATNYPLHHPKFEVNEAAIATGVMTMAYSAYRYWHTSA